MSTHPTEADARRIATSFAGAPPHAVTRFNTGTGNWVYAVEGPGEQRFVVRIGAAGSSYDGATHWSHTLRPLGVPLPALRDSGVTRGFPFLILERLPGQDLGDVYPALALSQKQRLAGQIVAIQRQVHALPEGRGFGYITLPGAAGLPSWHAVVDASLTRSRARTEAAGVLSPRPVQRVARQAARLARYFARVRPTPFLDDTTTKNVLLHDGALSGIVDVDWLCYGDPLLTLALTRTALLSSDFDTDYTDHWAALLALSDEQHAALRFYVAQCCVDFMSEIGQQFNGARIPEDPVWTARLEHMLDAHLG